MSQILAGDIGGTHARFALLDLGTRTKLTRRIVHQEVLDSRAYATFDAALQHFLDGAKKARDRGPIRAASFGIAGPVVDQRVKTTNLPWVIDARATGRKAGIPKLTLLNDLVALGLGALASSPAKLQVLHLGRPRKTGANVAVIAAGTGLGEAAFVWDGAVHVPCPTEGSHVDFAPRTPTEVILLAKLTRELGHVSYERVAAGSAITRVYEFFVRDQRVPESKANAALVDAAPDKNVAIVDLAERGKSEAAMRAVELWSSVYGAEAGNLALKSLATGGVFVCGGASARLAKILAHGLPTRKEKTSHFLDAFFDKGRMRPLLERIPIAVCTDSLAGLLGAATHAASQVSAKKR